MRRSMLILIVLFSISFLFADENEVLLLPYNTTTLTPEQQAMNPTFIAYPTQIKSDIPRMKCIYYFTVGADGHKVEFSKGNLQYKPKTKEWKFANHQWSIIGGNGMGNVYGDGESGPINSNNNITNYSYEWWLDLFAWGTSGWPRNEDEYYDPRSYDNTQKNRYLYHINGDGTANLDGTNADWGRYNQIGSNPPNIWRTLSKDEWQYLLYQRTNADNLRGYVSLTIGGVANSVTGYILLPDNWKEVPGLPVSNTETNVYTTAEWTQLEERGAILLPNSFYRVETTVSVGTYYWTSTADISTTEEIRITSTSTITCYPYAYCLHDLTLEPQYRSYGCSVRLVKDFVE